jgi:DNA-binding response OmpR family regulator
MAARVLVIEDDPDLRPLMEQILTEPGYRVSTAATGHAGLGHFEAHQPDLVLLDLLLPDLDGLEVCRRIRARSAVPVIMLTGLTAEPVVVAGLEAGADGYLTKPFSPGVLVARIQAALRRKQVPDPQGAAPDSRAGPAGRTVLLVDEAWMRETLALGLRTAGFEVLEAADAPGALDILGRYRPAAILLDLRLPGMDGVRFAEELRRRGLRPGIPIIVLSAAEGARQQAALIGAEACLAKPFRLTELLAEVARVTTAGGR